MQTQLECDEEHVFVVGRFSPLHRGHVHLVHTAGQLAAAVYVLSYANPEAPGCSTDVRHRWLHQLAEQEPKLVAQLVVPPPNAPRDDAPAAAHRDFCATVIEQQGWPITAVATSEAYGPGLARHLSERLGRTIRHLAIDPLRLSMPISGRRIRADPARYRRFMPDWVHQTYLPKAPNSPMYPVVGHPTDVLPHLGLTRADLYDAFLGRLDEVDDIIAFLRRLGLQPGSRVLDAGCGTGRLLQPMTDAGWLPTGLDADADYVDRARQRGHRVLHGQFDDAPQLALSFDAVLAANGPWVYLHDRADRMRALQAFRSVLRPGGHLVLDLPNLPWIRRHVYEAPSPSSTMVGDLKLTRQPRHDIDDNNLWWDHTDRHLVQTSTGVVHTCEERFRFRMLSPATVQSELVDAGFSPVTLWSGWDAAQPTETCGPRMLLTAIKPTCPEVQA